jgi:pimeloyl-ACP methyl ester carboxylesterase
MPTARNGDVELHYELDGPRDGEPVILIEGLGYGRWMWRWQRERLADDYRVILFDNRGTGDSDAPEGPYTMAEMASDVEAVLADAGPGESGYDAAHVVGASMGGMIAQQYALDYDRAATLTLLCTSHGGEERVPIPDATAEQMFAVPEGADEREIIEHRMQPAVSDGFFEANPDLLEQIVDWRLAGDAAETGRNAQAAAVEAFDVADRVGDIDQPTLVLHGDADRVVPIENGRMLHEKLPDSGLEIVDGGPHLFFVEEPDLVADLTREHLEANPIGGGDSTGDATESAGESR